MVAGTGRVSRHGKLIWPLQGQVAHRLYKDAPAPQGRSCRSFDRDAFCSLCDGFEFCREMPHHRGFPGDAIT